MQKFLAGILAIAFIGVCAVVLLRPEPTVTGNQGSATQATLPASKPVPSASTLPLVIVSGLSKKTWLSQAIEAYNHRQEIVAGKTVVVTAMWANSGDALRDMEENRLKPDLWSPTDESWFRQANDWSKGQGVREPWPAWKPLVHVPLVITMWEPMAKALGYPKPLGWADLAKLSTDPQGWAGYGHPEWGRFTWGHCHPDSANGFQTLVCAIYAAAGKTSGLTVEDLKLPSVRDNLTALEQSVEHYGVSSRWIDDFMHAKGPAYLSAAAQYENNVIEGNLASGGKPFPLVAIYPKEGTIFNDNPIAIPEADWITPEKREAGERFTAFLLSAEQQAAAVKTGLRPTGSTAAPGGPFTAVNGVAETVPDIPAFEVPSDRILKRVRDLWFETKKPASVTLIIDTSGSMQGESMERAKEGAITFLDQMWPKDEIEIIAFCDHITPLVDMAPAGSVREAARARLQALFAKGGTHLFDVADSALTRIAARKTKEPARHYGIVLLTDGKDEGSTLGRHDLMDKLPRDDAPEVVKVFTIAFGNDIDKSFLKELANRTNARMYESSAKNIVQVYTELSANF